MEGGQWRREADPVLLEEEKDGQNRPKCVSALYAKLWKGVEE